MLLSLTPLGTSDYTEFIGRSIGPFNDVTRRQCFQVSITDDMFLEVAENFAVDLMLTAGTERVRIEPSTATVTINDDDSTYTCLVSSAKVFFLLNMNSD